MNTDKVKVRIGLPARPSRTFSRWPREPMLSGIICVHLCSSVVALSLVSGCAIGPTYSRPETEVPAAFKEAGDWIVARPSDAVPKGKWWQVFNDPVLDGLMEQVSVSNQDLKAAEARYTQARAAGRSARSGFLPTLNLTSGVSRSRAAGNTSGASPSGNRYTVGVDAQWEIDVWGRIRRLVEAARAGEAASVADLEGARLSLQAELATNYFQLRVTDAQRDLFEDTVRAFTSSYNVTPNRYNAGVAGRGDVVQAEAQLKSTQAQAIDLRINRAQLEHAIAVLVGKPPGSFTLVPAGFHIRRPEDPPGLPPTLLQRRPDVAGAERRMAAANARIGVAQSAYFPAL